MTPFEPGEKQKWADLIVKVFDFTIYTFVDHAEMNAKQQLNAQREMILELSSPVITLSKSTALSLKRVFQNKLRPFGINVTDKRQQSC